MPTPQPNNLGEYLSYVDDFKQRFFRQSEKYKNGLEYWTKYYISRGETPEQAKGFAGANIDGGTEEMIHAFKCYQGKQELKIEIIIDLYDDTRKIEAKLKSRIREIRKQIYKAKRELPISQGPYGATPDYIRHPDNKIVKNPFETWNKILNTYEAWLNNGKKIDMNLVINLKSRNGKINEIAAYSRVKEDIVEATEFIRRAVVGTFPYNEKGEFKVDLNSKKI